MQYLPYFPSFICALILIIITLAFVFFKDFRTDLIGGSGKADLFGLISIEGVIIVILFGLLLGAMIYAFPNNVKVEIEHLSKELSESNDKVKSLEEERKINQPANFLATIEKLDPTEPLSKEIRKIQRDSKGPWSRFSASKNITISVPGAKAETRTYKKIVYGCSDYLNKALQIISDHENSKGLTIEVTVNGIINNASNCSELAGGVDIQLDCKSAAKLLTSEVLTCDDSGNPLWTEKVRSKSKKFPAYAVVIVNSM